MLVPGLLVHADALYQLITSSREKQLIQNTFFISFTLYQVYANLRAITHPAKLLSNGVEILIISEIFIFVFLPLIWKMYSCK
jgi:hypothetical protein